MTPVSTINAPSRARVVTRILISVIVTTIAIAFCDWVVPGFDTGSPLRFAVWLGVINGVMVPLIVRLAYPFVVYTAGLFSIVLNALAVLAAAELLDGVTVDGFGDAILVAVVVALVTVFLNTLLAINDDASWGRYVVRRAARRAGLHPTVTQARERGEEPTPGVIFLEIDGCSAGVLRRAVRAGWMPNLHAILLDDSHVIREWTTDLSSQTGASQAGLLLGSDEGIVAFRWFDRQSKSVVVSSAPKDAMAVEDRLSTGRGLLAGGGVSRNNLFAGDADESALTLSRMLRSGGAGDAYGSFFVVPYNVLQTLILAVTDIAHELIVNARMRRRKVWPRLNHKGWNYPFVRVATTVVLRDVTCSMLVGDVLRGVPSAYATFVGYDEVAHHDGVERPQALEQLRQLDMAFARVMRAAQQGPRPYEFVILSDHGQSQGATFLQRYGLRLEDLVRRHLGDGVTSRSLDDAIEPEAQFRAGRSAEAAQEASAQSGESVADVDVLVMASGNLGLVYFTEREDRATLEQLDDQYPGLVSGVAAHEGIGFVFVRTHEHGSIAIGADGSHNIHSGEIVGVDPLAPFGSDIVRKLRRHDEFANMPDLLIISMYDEQLGEVAAFEELIGSHGGVGGEQEHPFLVVPSHWSEPQEPLLGAPVVHKQLTRWMEEVGAR